MIFAQADLIKQQVAAHWNRRAAHFDEDFGHSIRTPAERAAWDRILDLILPAADALEALDIGCGTGFLSLELAFTWPPRHRRRFRAVNDRTGTEEGGRAPGRDPLRRGRRRAAAFCCRQLRYGRQPAPLM